MPPPSPPNCAEGTTRNLCGSIADPTGTRMHVIEKNFDTILCEMGRGNDRAQKPIQAGSRSQFSCSVKSTVVRCGLMCGSWLRRHTPSRSHNS